MAFEMSASQSVSVSVAFQDKRGNEAPVDGIPAWSTDNPNVLALAPAADGKSCIVSAMGPLGSATVILKADADMGDGTQEVVGSLEVKINAGQAAVVVLTPGVPQEQ